MASDPDLSLITRKVSERTGIAPDVVALVLQEGWGMMRARIEWDISEAKEEGLRLGARMGFAAKQEPVFPEEDGLLDDGATGSSS